MRTPVTAAALIALATAWPLSAQDTEEPAADGAEAAEAAADYDHTTVVATVGETEITLGHVIAILQKLPAQYQQLPDELLYTSLVEQLVNQELLARSALDQGEGDHHSIAIAVENERRGLLAGRALANIIAPATTEEALRAAYDAEVAASEPVTEFNANHILVETVEEAGELRTLVLEAPEEDRMAVFEALAAEHSTGPSGANGGSLGWFGSPDRQMVPEFQAAVEALEIGGVSEPVETQFGWHIILLNETREMAIPTFEQRVGPLLEQLRDEAIETEIEILRDDHAVTVVEGAVPAGAIRDAGLLAE